ncbi:MULTISPECIES: Ltp family lipoprotein [Bacillaceae]|uniref:Ltp family lipoprotein n=1 Tax=Evansella alkalicola TaxID=745819 RepID=A0ABS6JVJ2_9BACI|nr:MULTISPECIES: Ltp family lipoprotein [Bacillaceae]MBU9721709.1 Ltp family lipoprotein [Bacillus alkalicola]
MSTLFFILFLLSLIAIPVALIKPGLVRASSRPKALLVTVVSTLVFLILFAITAPEPVGELAEEEQEENEVEENVEIEDEVEEVEEAEEEEEIEEPAEEEAPAEEQEEVVEETESETLSQQNAVAMARDYLAYTAFSKSGLIDQLKFEGFDDDDATYAVNQINVDWREQAVIMAQDYLDYTSFSRSGLIQQLEFEGFSTEDATYAVDEIGL